MTMSLDSHVRLSDEAVFRELDGESVILDLRSGTYFGLNPVGTRIWQLVARCGTLRTVHEQLLREYDVRPDVLQRDLVGLAERLVASGLGFVS